MTTTQSSTTTPFGVRVGANLYAVEVVPGPLVGISGGTSAATIDDVGHRILIDNKLGAENAAQVAAAAVATAWQQAVAAYGEQLERAWGAFDAMTEAVDLDLDGELTEDDVGAVFAAFERLRKLGVRFDPPFVGRMVELERVTAGPRHEKGGTSSESFIDDDDDGPADDADDRHEYAGADDPDEARKLCHRDDQPALAKELARLAQGRRQRPHPVEPSLQVEQHPKPLRMNIGPFVYTVRVHDRSIMWDGKERMGLATHADRAILISPKLRAAARIEVLLHEVRHAWAFHNERRGASEVECQRFAMMALSALKDIVGYGGETAVEAIPQMALDPSDPHYAKMRFYIRDGRAYPIHACSDSPRPVSLTITEAAAATGQTLDALAVGHGIAAVVNLAGGPPFAANVFPRPAPSGSADAMTEATAVSDPTAGRAGIRPGTRIIDLQDGVERRGVCVAVGPLNIAYLCDQEGEPNFNEILSVQWDEVAVEGTPPGGAASPATKPRGPEMLFTIVKHYTNDDPDDEREWFRWVAIPAALRDSDGTPREADNVLYFSVSKAAILTNWNLSGLALNWGHAIGPECTPEERRAIGIQAREIHERYCCYSPVRDEAPT